MEPTKLEKLNASYTSQYAPPLEIDMQFALLFSYRRLLTEYLMLEEKLGNVEKARSEQFVMLQEWILTNPTPKKKRENNE